MDELNEWVEMGKELSSSIRPRSFPLAIKLIKPGENFPEKARFPVKDMGIKITICQAFSMSRLYGQTIAMAREDAIFCPGPLLWGWEEMNDEEELAEFWVKDLPFFEYPELGMQTIKAMQGAIVPKVLTFDEMLAFYPETKGKIIARVEESLCNGCGICEEVCTFDSINLNDGSALVNSDLCEGCRLCVAVCPSSAIELLNVSLMRKKGKDGDVP